MSDLNDQLKGIFDSAEFQPTDKVWAGVEKALIKKKKNRGIFWMWQTYATAAAVLFIGAFAFIQNGGGGSVSSLNEGPKNTELSETLKDSTEQMNQKSDTLISPINSGIEDLVAKNESQSSDLVQEPSRIASASLTSVDQTLETDEMVQVNQNSFTQEENISDQFYLLEMKPLRETLAWNILAFNAKMNMVPYNPDLGAADFDFTEEESIERELRINGGIGSGSYNTGESSLFSGAMEDAAIAFSEARADIVNGEEKVESVFSIGAGINYGLSKRLSLDAGLRLSNFSISSSSNAYSVEAGESLPISGTAPFDPTEVLFVGDYGTSNTFQSMFLQTALNYKIASIGKFDFNTRMGVGLDFFFNYRLQGDLNFLSVRKVNLSESDISSTSLSITPGLGINYRLNKQFGLGIDASYRRFLTNSSVSVNGGTSIFGFGFSLNYLLSKD